MKSHYDEDDSWNADCRLGTTGPKGTLFLKKGSRLFELFKVKPSPGDKGKVQITLAEDLAKMGIGQSKAKSWVDSAIAKAHAFENRL